MYKPAGIINIYGGSIKMPKRKIPKSLMGFFLTLNLCFGIDFGFLKPFSIKFRELHKYVSILVSVINLILIMPPFNREEDRYIAIWYSVILAQYTTYFFILQFAKYTVYDFIIDVYNLNEEDTVTAINTEIIGLIASIYAFVLIFAKALLFTAYCKYQSSYNCDSYFFKYYVNCVLNQSVDTIPVIQTLFYYYIYCCMKNFKESLSNIKINLILKRYMTLTECFDKIKPLHDNLLIALLFFEVPKFMGTLWNMLRLIEVNDGWLEFVNEFSYCGPILVHICAPAIIAEMVGSQFDDMKLLLHDVLITEGDKNKILEVNCMLRYMEARSSLVQHKARGIVPVDLRLPVSLFSICTSYFIVILQFTHLYG